ncbi:MAG: hypothetical protein JWP13_653 [Candidatus Saccharibacteria bacterium]|nr:hypothetical protein [Candidatus Saccharibacteria bacterium]
MMQDSSKGFTLIEMLLSVLIIGLITGASLPLYASFQNRNNLDTTTQDIAYMLRRAQTYARGMNGDSPWGVQVATNSVTMFEGSTYATRDTTEDEIISVPGSLTLSGPAEMVFAKLTAAPNTTGSIIVSSPSTNDTRTITVNAEGMVAY